MLTTAVSSSQRGEGFDADSRLRVLLRVGSIRYAALYYVPFYGAVHAAGRGSVFWAVAGAVLCVAVCLGVELANRCSDRVEDRINRLERTALCEALGYRDLGGVTLAIFTILAAIGVLWFFAFLNWSLFFVQLAVWCVAWNYSYGVRFKGRRLASTLVLSLTFLLPYTVAWAMFRSVLELPAAVLVAPAFVISLCGAKDITDIPGDEARGYASHFVSLLRSRSTAPLLAWIAMPYALVGVLWSLGWIGDRFLLLFALLPLSVAFAAAARGASTPQEAAAVRELTYHLWFAIIVLVVALIAPSVGLWVVLALAAGFWGAATRRLHWFVGLRPDQFATFAAIMSRSWRGGARAARPPRGRDAARPRVG